MDYFNDIINLNIENKFGLVGLNDELFSLYINKLFKEKRENMLIVTSNLFEATLLNNFLNNYTNDAFLFPVDEFLSLESLALSPELKVTRLETLNEIIDKKKKIVITDINGYLRYLPNKKTYENSILRIEKNKEYPREEMLKNLANLGYNRETIVKQTGEIAIRGFVIDIFPIGYKEPIRMEFFGDLLESIRLFDIDDQKTIKEIEELTISPNTENIVDNQSIERKEEKRQLHGLNNEIVSIIDYLDDPIVIFKNYSSIKTVYFKLREEILEYRDRKDSDYIDEYMFSLESILPKKVGYYNTIDNIFQEIPKKNVIDFKSSEIESFNENIEKINKYLKENLDNKKTIIIALKDYQIKSITRYIESSYILTKPNKLFAEAINIIELPLNKGFSYENTILLTEKELFIKQQVSYKYKTSYKMANRLKSISNIEIGDYVVHNLHGIGKYNGIKTLTQNGLLKDYLEILYLGSDKLYIPVEKIELISKYTGKEGFSPRLHKLGGTEWYKTKQRIKTQVRDIAEKLLKIYATRENKEGYRFRKDDELQQMFEEEFEYEATKDQIIVTKQIKEDMETPTPMDRLLCGDVGYGKTEVAFRAMFKAINDGKQVLYLCPTTILSKQQYENALTRFKNFPINIGLLNRFTSQKESKNLIEALKEGKIDLVFGTHRLLSDDVRPKDLGLLIVDEEQRFGVIHKEKIKEYKENVDVLTLTATPIPRTLQMAMTGLRSLSLIETPPVDRYPVQTYVIEENDYLIRDAIYKEKARGGQAFILYNNVEHLESKKHHLQELMPDISIIEAHGQMNKLELENRMIDFVSEKYDVLLCTTIIETGIDIPNVNTLIILDADYFGLSQLYQIRGRVGRSNKIAYAYLMYKKNKILTETATKRLNVIKEFTELGSGFAIASRDLAIRGAGNILGSEQAGYIDSIGIELYLKILNEEVERLKGNIIEEDIETEETKPLLNVETHIDKEYVEESELRIEIHKKINTIDSKETFEQVKTELEDRFGKLNSKILDYMYEEWFDKIAKIKGVEKVITSKKSIDLYFSKEISENINGEELFLAAFNISQNFKFKYIKSRLIVILDLENLKENKILIFIKLLSTIT